MIIFSILFMSLAFAQVDEELSASRDLETDYTQYEQSTPKSLRRTPLSTAKLYNEETLPKATTWASKEMMQSRFEGLRDEKFLIWAKEPDMLRRSSWLYPDDGCFARAALAMRNMFKGYAPLAKKVFVFGNLRVKTRNSPKGIVGWWFHVAPIVEVKNVKYVLDPAINPLAPLTLKEWLQAMGKPEKMKVAICASGAYSPSDNCDKESDGLELRAERSQQKYLGLEYVRLAKMGRLNEL